jgi:hypothetical protein
MDKELKKQFNWRAFVSVLAGLSFIAMTFTGVILFVVPPGRIANWTGWTIMALTKSQWIALHDWFCLVFVAASILHVYLNWKALVSYFKGRVSKAFAFRTEWLLALAVCVGVFFGAMGNVAPFSSLVEWGERIKHTWDTPLQRAPIPHAELLSLGELSKQVPKVGLDTMLANLRAEGIEVDSADVVLGDLAEAHSMTPMQLYEIALGQTGPGRGYGGAGKGGGRGQGAGGPGQRIDTHAETGGSGVEAGPGQGFGRLTVKQYCEQAGLDIETCVARLKKAGFEATPEMTFRAIADAAGVRPSEVRAVLEPQTH